MPGRGKSRVAKLLGNMLSTMPELRHRMLHQCAPCGHVPFFARLAMNDLSKEATGGRAKCFGYMPSSVIRQYRYDAPRRRLDVAFVSGETYSYFDVPGSIADGLKSARSKGRYFQQNIRDRFDFRRDRTGRAWT